MNRIDRYRTRSYQSIWEGVRNAQGQRLLALLDMLVSLARARHAYAVECALDTHKSVLDESYGRPHDKFTPADYMDGRESILSRKDVADLIALIPTLEELCDPYLEGTDESYDEYVTLVYLHIKNEMQSGTWPVTLKGRSPALVQMWDGATIILAPQGE
ncbi:MAG: hypothetical protein ABIP74_01260 [Candidatus Saccharimonas sp.]